MKKYDVFDLKVVKFHGNYFICEKLVNNNIYVEIFTKEKFMEDDCDKIKPLINYYPLLVIKNYTTGKHLMLTKKELLLKYAEINASHIVRKKDLLDNYVETLKIQDERLKMYNELVKNNPELAKKVATNDLVNSGIIDENGELCAPYNEEVDKKITTVQVKGLRKKYD